MSAAGLGGPRRPLDAYQTPYPLALAALARMPWLLDGARVALEPSAGGGAWVRALRAARASDERPRPLTVLAVDLDPAAPGLALADLGRAGDFLAWEPDPLARPDLVVGNPPFSAAEAHARHALAVARPGSGRVALLLRLAFLEGLRRLPFWREHPPSVVLPLARRPSFTGGGTDSCAYAVFAWDLARSAPPVLEWPPLAW